MKLHKIKIGDKVQITHSLFRETRTGGIVLYPPIGYIGKIRGNFKTTDGQMLEDWYYIDNWIIGWYSTRIVNNLIFGQEIPLNKNALLKIDSP